MVISRSQIPFQITKEKLKKKKKKKKKKDETRKGNVVRHKRNKR